jgi:RIO-like serine/threonine protein kinase
VSDGSIAYDPTFANSQKDILTAKFEELKALPSRSGLNQGDCTLKNVTVDRQGNVQLLDWGSALVHSTPYYDVSQILKTQIEINDPTGIS